LGQIYLTVDTYSYNMIPYGERCLNYEVPSMTVQLLKYNYSSSEWDLYHKLVDEALSNQPIEIPPTDYEGGT